MKVELIVPVVPKYCNKCPALVLSRKQITCSYGDKKSKVMLIGEAPGQKGCNITGIPFTRDRSGRFLQHCLHQTGIDFDKVYTANIVKCSPPRNRTPVDEEIKSCITYLYKEIGKVNPEIIITLGRTATKNIIGHDDFSVFKNACDSIPMKLSNGKRANVFIMPHPAAVLRGEEKLKKTYMNNWKFLAKKMQELKYVDTNIMEWTK